MNLQEFINYRGNCPFCQNILTTEFIPNRGSRSLMEEDRFISIHTMKSLGKNQIDYKVQYCFELKSNSFSIEFDTEWDTSKQIPLHLIAKFKQFHSNMEKSYSFYFGKRCLLCNKYYCSSSPINMDLKQSSYNPPCLDKETFAFGTGLAGINGLILINFLSTQTSCIELRTHNPIAGYKQHNISVPLIDFVSEEITGNRLKNLIVFS